jgi:transposase-like protein
VTNTALYFPGKQSYDCRVTGFSFNVTYYYVFYGFIRRGPGSRA